MTALARYVPDGRILDLSKLTPDDYRLVISLHGAIRHGEPVLACLQTGGDPEMYIRKIGGAYWACHFAGGGHGSHEVARMSDEHRRATDYIVRAADDAGYPTATEVTTSNRTRLDAAIFGPRVTGAEVQWSDLGTRGTRGARSRTTRSLNAAGIRGPLARPLPEGILPIWFSMRGHPDWLYKVPTIQAPGRPWERLPGRQVVRALGIREVTIEPCRPGAPFQQCPERGYSFCGGFHPWARPRGGDESKGSLTVDDVFAMVPARQFVPVSFRGYIYLVDAGSAARLKEFAGAAAGAPAAAARGPLASSPRTCYSPAHTRIPVAGRRRSHPDGLVCDEASESRGKGVFFAGLCVVCGRSTTERGEDGLPRHRPVAARNPVAPAISAAPYCERGHKLCCPGVHECSICVNTGMTA